MFGLPRYIIQRIFSIIRMCKKVLYAKKVVILNNIEISDVHMGLPCSCILWWGKKGEFNFKGMLTPPSCTLI